MDYTEKNIKVLKGLDAVKKRPGMYIGNTEDGSGLHRMLFEILDNALDEYYAGFCTKIVITLHTNGSITVDDDGRGIPTESYRNTTKTTAEIILTTLHSGAKFDNNTYKFSSGLHGVGLSVVNALSRNLTLTVVKKTVLFVQKYENGTLLSTSYIKNNIEKKQGTIIQFAPNQKIIKPTVFNTQIIQQRLEELSFLNKNITFKLFDENTKAQHTFTYEKGLQGFLQHLIKKKKTIGTPFFLEDVVQDTHILIGLQWTESEVETLIGYTNNTKQKEGGTHITGLRAGITKALFDSIKNLNIAEKDKVLITNSDILEGLIGVVSIKTTEPKFTSQTKEKLITTQVKNIVDTSCRNALSLFFIKQKETCKLILNKIVQAAKVRMAAKKIKDSLKKEDFTLSTPLPGKLAECRENNPDKTELFLVEGDSAGGSAKQARCKKYQAILPLKGKIINAGKATLCKLVENDEIRSIVTALGCTIDKNKYTIKNLRYKTIIIMTDADTDGSHIRSLLLTFFFKHLPELFYNENLYIAQPPLYKVQQNKKFKYINDDAALKDYVIKLSLENVTVTNKTTAKRVTTPQLETLLRNYEDFKNKLKKIIGIDVDVIFQHLFSNVITLTDALKKKEMTINDITTCLNILTESTDVQPCVFKKETSTFHFLIKKKEIVLEEHTFTKIIHPLLLECLNLHNSCFEKTTLKICASEKVSFAANVKEIYDELVGKVKKKINIQRYKGLGEMNPEKLWETTMCPKNRRLKKIKIFDILEATTIFNTLMGTDIDNRKKFITDNVLLYNEN